jgi:hypothetical protein
MKDKPTRGGLTCSPITRKKRERREHATVLDAPSIPGTHGYLGRPRREMAMATGLILQPLPAKAPDDPTNEKGMVAFRV